ncbi:MAG: DUF502 domain-containing protein [Gammaproteobacteria bacterium]|nr:DUF502 domain-containing protein [Gammaproteobacteria bacterium]
MNTPIKTRGVFLSRAQRYILTGIITIIPLWFTFSVFEFFLGQLSEFGLPWAEVLIRAWRQFSPDAGEWLTSPWFINSLAVIMTVLALYLLGFIATRVIGQRVLDLFDQLMSSIPLVQNIYGAVKKLIAVLQNKPDGMQRVVLIEFPAKHLRAVGFVTRTMQDKTTGQTLAAVFVPTTPNPTGGYLQIVPLDSLVETGWNMDEAMTFILSGGAVAPEQITYHRPPSNST